MASSFQVVIDCADPEPLARFWAAALGYELELPPAGFASWDEYWRDVGVPEDELGIGADCIIDPAGGGPRIWFQVVPERKAVKNRLHLDIGVSGGRAVPMEIRQERVDAAASRLAGLGAVIVGDLNTDGLDHYAVGPLRGRDEGPRGQRVRHQLTATAAATCSPAGDEAPAPSARCPHLPR